MRKIIPVILIVLLFTNCKKVNKKIPVTPFNIENLNNIKVKSFKNNNLNSQGYDRIMTDLLIYEKKVKDTLVQLEFDNRSEKVRKKRWQIKLAKDELELINFIQKKYNVISLDGYTRRDYKNKVFSFPVIDLKNNAIFLCYTSKRNNEYYLNIDYYNEKR